MLYHSLRMHNSFQITEEEDYPLASNTKLCYKKKKKNNGFMGFALTLKGAFFAEPFSQLLPCNRHFRFLEHVESRLRGLVLCILESNEGNVTSYVGNLVRFNILL